MKRYSKIKQAFEPNLKIVSKREMYFDGIEVNLIDGVIPDFITEPMHKVTKKQAKFYNEIKFPNYDDLEDFGLLIDKGEKNIFTKSLDDEIGFKKRILELGCGTGQLSLFLSRGKREICAVDLSSQSLILGEDFRKKNEIEDVFFIRSDVFDLKFRANYFDYIISNGVLHHTKNPKEAFGKLVKVLKPRGYIVIGLYHQFGRLVTVAKQKLAKLIGSNIANLDKYSRQVKSEAKKSAWVKDQFFNPHETLHLPEEIFFWFNQYGIDFINLLPFYDLNTSRLFEKKNIPDRGTLFAHNLFSSVDTRQIQEGGFFIIIGQKI